MNFEYFKCRQDWFCYRAFITAMLIIEVDDEFWNVSSLDRIAILTEQSLQMLIITVDDEFWNV